MEVHSTWVSDLGFRVHSSPSGSPRGLRDQITAVAGLDCLHLLVVLVSWLAWEIRAEAWHASRLVKHRRHVEV